MIPDSRPSSNRVLTFAQGGLEAWREVVAERVQSGTREIVLVGPAEVRSAVLTQSAEWPLVNFQACDDVAEAAVALNSAARPVVLLLGTDEGWLQRQLQQLKHLPAVDICAPLTRLHQSSRPVFVQSIPKSGTHLLFECLRGMGYGEPASLDLPEMNDGPQGGRFYNLQHLRTTELALPFHHATPLIDSLAKSVILFIVRDPRDVAVSLAHYLAKQLDYHLLAAWMRKRTPDERLRVVLSGEFPIPMYVNRHFGFRGTIRDLVNAYADWIRDPLPNVHFVCFEHLVGVAGGGSREKQLQSLWELQLALHVPGSPEEFADRVFSKNALTFRKGQIGSFRDEFRPEHERMFRELPQDFMELTGYAIDRPPLDCVLPTNAAFTGETVLPHTPPHVVEQRQQYNIVYHSGTFTGLPVTLGDVDVEAPETAELPGIFSSRSITDVREAIDLASIPPELPVVEVPPQLVGVQDGFNFVLIGGRYIAIEQTLGQIDLAAVTDEQWSAWAEEGHVLMAETLAQLQESVRLRPPPVEEVPSPAEGTTLDGAADPANSEAAAADAGEPGAGVEEAPAGPELVLELARYNLVAWQGVIYGLAHRLGPVDLRELTSGQQLAWMARGDLVVGRTVPAMRRKLALSECWNTLTGRCSRLHGWFRTHVTSKFGF